MWTVVTHVRVTGRAREIAATGHSRINLATVAGKRPEAYIARLSSGFTLRSKQRGCTHTAECAVRWTLFIAAAVAVLGAGFVVGHAYRTTAQRILVAARVGGPSRIHATVSVSQARHADGRT